jgi:hypothetical protein
MQQWEDSRKDPTLLLPPGLPLEEGRRLRDEPGDVLVGDVLPYIEASIASDRRRLRRRNLLAFTVFLLLSAGNGVVTWQWLQAREHARIAASERDRAERNLDFAARAANGLVYDLGQGLRDVSGVSVEMLRRILGGAVDLLNKVAGGDDAPANLKQASGAAFGILAGTYLAQGDTASALTAAERAREIHDKLAEAEPDSSDRQRDLSVSWEKLGAVRQAQGDLAGALAAYEARHAIAERLAASDPGNAGWQRDLSVSWNKRHYGADAPSARSGMLLPKLNWLGKSSSCRQLRQFHVTHHRLATTAATPWPLLFRRGRPISHLHATDSRQPDAACILPAGRSGGLTAAIAGHEPVTCGRSFSCPIWTRARSALVSVLPTFRQQWAHHACRLSPATVLRRGRASSPLPPAPNPPCPAVPRRGRGARTRWLREANSRAIRAAAALARRAQSR